MTYKPLVLGENLPPIRINLYSDTQTQPTGAMKDAMMTAVVGDEQSGTDPTVDALCDRVADLLGKEAAVFLPSGTMCNVAAILVHTRPGQEVIAHETSHILMSEGGAHAAFSGVQICPLHGRRGQFVHETLEKARRPKVRHAPEQALLSVEQTANLGGGTIWPLDQLNEVLEIAKSWGLSTHMDGARLMNAVIATGVPAHVFAEHCDSVWIDFTKGLGAPLGAVLAGSAGFVGEAWRWKQRLGGAMRQAGICAAACLYALDCHVERLADDHQNAKRLAEGLSRIPGLVVDPPDTNLVYFDPRLAGVETTDLVHRLRLDGVHVSMLQGRIRACTHLDVTQSMVDEAVAAVKAQI
ncbi:MAG: threonine aldolase family protein [Hyphomicrobiaceae bacterium]